MKLHRSMRPAIVAWLAALGCSIATGVAAEAPPSGGAVARGRYVFYATGGCSCHTNLEAGGEPLAGGRPLETPFGTFYSTNITPDVDTGIGAWSDDDFLHAMKHGIAPDGTVYFPIFPYTSFTHMTDGDVNDLKAYLFSLEPVRRANRPHALRRPYGWRIAARLWQWLYFDAAPLADAPERSAEWHRGRYLAVALGHCRECHTARTRSGALDPLGAYAGTEQGPDGALVPNITPDDPTGIAAWTEADIAWYLETGLMPDGNDAQGVMRELIDQGYEHLTREDRDAIATFLRSLTPIHNELRADDADE